MKSVGNVTVYFKQGSNADRKQPTGSQKRVYFQQKAPNAAWENLAQHKKKILMCSSPKVEGAAILRQEQKRDLESQRNRVTESRFSTKVTKQSNTGDQEPK